MNYQCFRDIRSISSNKLYSPDWIHFWKVISASFFSLQHEPTESKHELPTGLHGRCPAAKPNSAELRCFVLMLKRMLRVLVNLARRCRAIHPRSSHILQETLTLNTPSGNILARATCHLQKKLWPAVADEHLHMSRCDGHGPDRLDRMKNQSKGISFVYVVCLPSTLVYRGKHKNNKYFMSSFTHFDRTLRSPKTQVHCLSINCKYQLRLVGHYYLICVHIFQNLILRFYGHIFLRKLH